MLNVSRMPMIRPGFTQIDACRTRPRNPYNSQANKLGELVDLGKVRSSHEGLSNTKIYSNESLSDLKRENLRFGGSKGQMVFFRLRVVS